MGGTHTPSPNQNFQDRLARVAEKREPIEAAKPYVQAVPDWKQNAKYPAALVAAAALGMLAVFAARYVRFHLFGGTMAGDDPDFTMIIDAGIAMACAFALFAMLRFSDKSMKTAQTFGIVFMIGVMHNMVHVAPGLFSTLFSEEWTEDIIAYSEPGSIYFRGNYFKVIEDKEVAEAAVPTEDGTSEDSFPKMIRMDNS
ncbi:MAG: hypothetical protein OXQ92_12895 [Boseongicola sp.]|nr:hypothetical protein [Boseongicola sp.]MDD9976596.1 hypothetical protein [Boseongicola sp.]